MPPDDTARGRPPQVVLLCGVAGSGKTTHARDFAAFEVPRGEGEEVVASAHVPRRDEPAAGGW